MDFFGFYFSRQTPQLQTASSAPRLGAGSNLSSVFRAFAVLYRSVPSMHHSEVSLGLGWLLLSYSSVLTAFSVLVRVCPTPMHLESEHRHCQFVHRIWGPSFRLSPVWYFPHIPWLPAAPLPGALAGKISSSDDSRQCCSALLQDGDHPP